MGPLVNDVVTRKDDGSILNTYAVDPSLEKAEADKRKARLKGAASALAIGAVAAMKYLFGSEEPIARESRHAYSGEEEASPSPDSSAAQRVTMEDLLLPTTPNGAVEHMPEAARPQRIAGGSGAPILFGDMSDDILDHRTTTSLGPQALNDNEALYNAPPGQPILISTGAEASAAASSGGGGGGGGSGEQPGPISSSSGPNPGAGNRPNGQAPSANNGIVNRAPVVERSVRLDNLLMNQSVLITVAMLLEHASDADGDTLGVWGLSASSGTLVAQGPGAWLFTPVTGDTSDVTFRYFVSDGELIVPQLALMDIVSDTVTRISGTEGDDVIIGTVGADMIDSAAGNDTVIGREGDDTIEGGPGDDRLVGGSGDDVIYAGDGDDFVSGGEGNDTIFGGRGDDHLFGDEGDDVIFGEEGNDRLDGGTGNDRLFGDEGDDELSGGEGNDFLDGGVANDKLDGGGGSDILVGGAGSDEVNGSTGNDVFIAMAGDGDDAYNGGAGEDVYDLSGTSADATVDLSSATASSTDIGNDTLTDVESAVGGSGDDTFVGDSGANTFDGGSGNDQFIAAAGDGNDTFIGGDGSDTYDMSATTAPAVVDLYNGVASSSDVGTDTLVGVENAVGGSGSDVIVAGAGDGTLTGGPGADYFVFVVSGSGRSGSNKIMDFEVGDRVDIRDLDRDAGEFLEDLGFKKFVLINSGAEFTEPGQVKFRYEDLGAESRTVVEVNVDRDAETDFELELKGLVELRDEDFGRSPWMPNS